jgi:hypothetical protein
LNLRPLVHRHGQQRTCRRLRKHALTCANTSSRRFEPCSSLTSRAGFWLNIWGICAACQLRGAASQTPPNSTTLLLRWTTPGGPIDNGIAPPACGLCGLDIRTCRPATYGPNVSIELGQIALRELLHDIQGLLVSRSTAVRTARFFSAYRPLDQKAPRDRDVGQHGQRVTTNASDRRWRRSRTP